MTNVPGGGGGDKADTERLEYKNQSQQALALDPRQLYLPSVVYTFISCASFTFESVITVMFVVVGLED